MARELLTLSNLILEELKILHDILFASMLFASMLFASMLLADLNRPTSSKARTWPVSEFL